MNIADRLQLKYLGGKYAAIMKSLQENKKVGIVFAIPVEKIHLASCNGHTTLHIVTDRIEARRATNQINELLGEGSAVTIPEREDLLTHRHLSSLETSYERVAGLTSLIKGDSKVIVMPIHAIMQFYPKVNAFKELIHAFSVGDRWSLEELANRLIKANYIREDKVYDKGTFAIRGEIVEIFPIDCSMPYRLVFFDDEIESIKIFEPESMLSTNSVQSIIVPPASDILITDPNIREKFADLDLGLFTEKKTKRLEEIKADIDLIMELGLSTANLVWLIPFMKKSLSTIFDYLPSDVVITVDSPSNIYNTLDLTYTEHSSRVLRMSREGDCLARHLDSIISKEVIMEKLLSYPMLCFSLVLGSNALVQEDINIDFKGKAVNSYYLNFDMLVRDLRNFMHSGMDVVICANTMAQCKVLQTNLKDKGIGAVIEEELPAVLQEITLLPVRLTNGLIIPETRLIIIGTNEVFRPSTRHVKAKNKRGVFTMPEAGDYVSHEMYGIGLCKGVVSLTSEGITNDYVLVEYRDDAKLYVPIDKLDFLERYRGASTENIKLSRIGGKEFEQAKERVRKSVKQMAINLVEVYSKREKEQGIKYSADTPWQSEFEDSFIYEETSDQIQAIVDIKEDMEQGRIMDRLICGDVGYGKTEVALRAVFKTIMGGKQAAILAPTTILAEQHFVTALGRFEKFGVRCAVLSRFLTRSEILVTLNKIAKGEIDVVVATQRLLSKDVVFKDLGLLVLDEEQRFGVEHKEKLKSLKTHINVLTLTATPIPRTLNMALTGVRDISILETPPVGRLPVATYVVEFTDSLIIDASNRELARGGQVIILYNKVAKIQDFAEKIRSLVSNASIEIAHGQMSDNELERAIINIYEERANILICSTIIENGIDLPSANTLIVIDSDKLGLTELYQLRGRVGRRDRLASAYFTVPEGKVLTKDAERRLQALVQNTEFGSGFKIAMADLEIRGAGNILGREQSGHMQKVGYDLYCKLLDEAVRELKGETVINASDTNVKINIDAYLKNGIIAGSKMRIYKQISRVSSLLGRDELIKEISNTIGIVPQPLINLIDISLIRSLASKILASTVIINNKQFIIKFIDDNNVLNADLLYALSLMEGKAQLNNSKPLSISFNLINASAREKMDILIDFLSKANGIHQ